MKHNKKFIADAVDLITEAALKEYVKSIESDFIEQHLKSVVDMLNTALEMASLYHLYGGSEQLIFNQADFINCKLDEHNSKYRIFTKEGSDFKLMRIV